MGCTTSSPEHVYVDIYHRDPPVNYKKNIPLLTRSLIDNQLMNQYFAHHHINDVALVRIVEAFHTVQLTPNETITRENVPSEYVYILETGTIVEKSIVSKNSNTKEFKKYDRPGVFGEADFLYNQLRKFGFVSQTEALIHYLSLEELQKMVDEANTRNLYEVPLFSVLTKAEKNLLDSKVKRQRFAAGEVIFSRNDRAEFFYIIAKGKVKLMVPQATADELNSPREASAPLSREGSYSGPSPREGKEASTPGSRSKSPRRSSRTDTILAIDGYFGEDALILNKPYSSTAVAIDNVEVFVIDRNTFDNHLGSSRNILEERVNRTNLRMMTRRSLRSGSQTLSDDGNGSTSSREGGRERPRAASNIVTDPLNWVTTSLEAIGVTMK